MCDSQLKEQEQKKRFLKRYKKNIYLIERLENRLIGLDERICKIKSSNFSAMPRGSTPVDISDLISDKTELEARIKRLRKKSALYKTQILDKIDELDDVRYAEILESFFIDCKSFEDIAEDMGYTTRHVIRIYSEAISKVSI